MSTLGGIYFEARLSFKNEGFYPRKPIDFLPLFMLFSLNKVKRRNAMVALAVGTKAPDFILPTTPDQKVSLSEFKGRNVILVFYPADWSPVCGDQLALYNELREQFENLNASLVAISVDGIWCHLAYEKDRSFHFTLLSDFEPKGEVARRYGVYRQQEGISERALFVIDGEGVIRYSYVSPVGVNPGAAGILKALHNIATKEQAA
jgi:peroxiredoxin